MDNRQDTKFKCRYLGSQIKAKKDNDKEFYGAVTLVFHGVREDDGQPWYSVQEQYMSVDRMKEICKDIPFDTKCIATYTTGSTPGARQRLVSLEVDE